MNSLTYIWILAVKSMVNLLPATEPQWLGIEYGTRECRQISLGKGNRMDSYGGGGGWNEKIE